MTRPALLLTLLATLGCSELDNCPDTASEPILVVNGSTDVAAGFYESSRWDEPREAFPAKTCMRFQHGLEATPELVTTYVSFHASGSDATENAGNQGRIKCVDDSEIVIFNDTCEESFFIRVAAHASGSSHAEVSCADLADDACR